MKQTKRSVIALSLATIAVAIWLTACTAPQRDTAFETRQDVRVAERDDDPARIVNFPDGYPNIAHKCNNTTGIYVTSNKSGDTVRQLEIVANDPACQ